VALLRDSLLDLRALVPRKAKLGRSLVRIHDTVRLQRLAPDRIADSLERLGLLIVRTLVNVPNDALRSICACQTEAIEIDVTVAAVLDVEAEKRVTEGVWRGILAEVAGTGHAAGACLAQIAR